MQLTHRETEIVGLVSQGLTNQEVAERINVKRKTVDQHLNNIYTKTDLKNRTQLISLIVPDFFKEVAPQKPDIKASKKASAKRIKRILCDIELKQEINRLKTQRLKAAILASSMIDYTSSSYVKEELRKLLSILSS